MEDFSTVKGKELAMVKGKGPAVYRYIPVKVAVVLGLLLSAVATMTVWQWEREGLQHSLQESSDSVSAALQETIDSNLAALTEIGKLSARQLEQQEFTKLASEIMWGHPSIHRIDWSRRVVDDHPQDGKIGTASIRPEDFPITYTYPNIGNHHLLGKNIASEPLSAEAMAKAAKSGEIGVTQEFSLSPSSETAIGVFQPVYHNGRGREQLLGFVAGTIILEELVKAALPGLALEDLNVYLYEGQLNSQHRPLVLYDFKRHTFVRDLQQQSLSLGGRGWLCIEFRSVSNSASGRAFRKLRQSKEKPCHRQLKVGSREWSVLLLPEASYHGPQKYLRTWGTLLSGLILTSLLGIYLRLLQRYTKQVEGLAAERTTQAQQLQAALEELQSTQTMLIHSEKMSSLGQMVAGIAHEINNPVNFISGNISCAQAYIEDLLGLLQVYQQHYPHDREIEEYIPSDDLDFMIGDLPSVLGSMQMGVDRICQIVQSMRNFSRIDKAEAKSIDLHEGIDSTLLILHHRLKAKPNSPEIKLIKEYGNLPLVQCYPGQLNQVFMNILANAIDALDSYNQYREASEIQANPSFIAIRTEVENLDRVTVRIADNGPGIPADVQKRIFDPFFTTKPAGKGTGLGMSISYKIVVDKHQGTITCHSELGKGTEFEIEIPVQQRVKLARPNLQFAATA